MAALVRSCTTATEERLEVELGLDGSIDDLPPLTTRFIPSCARVVNVFCWCYFVVFWTAVVLLARHVASTDPHTLLPGPADFVFVAACTALLVGAELCVYCYVKKENALPDSRGPMGDNFTPSTACILAHCSLSATTRMCTFLELLFLLHARVLPTPMLACATFTVCLTRGLVPFLLQLRSLTGYLCGDAFDPLHCSTCIPFASFESCIINCGRGSLTALSKVAGLVCGAALGVRRGFKRLADLCTIRFIRRTVSVAPSRRLDASCWLQGTNTSMARLSEACEAGLPAGDSNQEARASLSSEGRAFASLKGPLVRLGLAEGVTGEPACGGSEGEAVHAHLIASHAVSTEASLREGWTDHVVERRSGETPRDAVHGQDAEASLCDNNFMRAFSSSPSRAVTGAARGGRGSPVFVSPRLALELTNCLLFLDLPTLTLHLKTVIIYPCSAASSMLNALPGASSQHSRQRPSDDVVTVCTLATTHVT
ncbi:hypothetical protein Emag_003984 [Eimeria magna]